MKKILFLLVTLLVTPFCYAQTTYKLSDIKPKKAIFRCNHAKYYAEKDSAQFVIISLEGLSQKDIFHKLILTLNDIYVDFEKVVSKIENEAVTVNGYYKYDEKRVFTIGSENKIYYQLLGFPYRFSFKIKDGKMRIDAPYISSIDYYNDKNKRKEKNSLFYLDSMDKDDFPGTLCRYITWDLDEVLKDILTKFSKQVSGTDDNW